MAYLVDESSNRLVDEVGNPLVDDEPPATGNVNLVLFTDTDNLYAPVVAGAAAVPTFRYVAFRI
jgi:hypothetical protein